MPGDTYIVKHGDNLWKIAREQGLDFQALKEANPELVQRVPPYGINPGDALNLPRIIGPLPTSPSDSPPDECTTACPLSEAPRFILEIKLAEPTSSTDAGTVGDFMGIGGFEYKADLAHHKASPIKGWIGYFVDTTGNSHKRKAVPKSGDYLAEGYEARYFDIGESEYDNMKNLYIWSGDLRLSFFVDKSPEDSLASMRLKIPRRLGSESTVAKHPASHVALPEGSRMFSLRVEVIESPIAYMRDETNKNVQNNDFPSNGIGWGLRAQEGRQWDYKGPIRKVWGDKIRLGNHAKATDTGSFSNYHIGYVMAASGLSLDDSLGIANKGQWLSTQSEDPPEDTYALSEGHAQFGANIETRTVQAPVWDFETMKMKEVLVKQNVSTDLTLDEMWSFLKKYQENWDALD